MLVARSFKYSSSPTQQTVLDEKKQKHKQQNGGHGSTRRRVTTPLPTRPQPTPLPPSPMIISRPEMSRSPSPSHSPTTEPMTIPTRHTKPHPPSPVPAGTPHHATNAMPLSKSATTRGDSRRGHATHDPNALSPAVAALLAVTAIPRHRPHRHSTRRSQRTEQISIDQLMDQWRNDAAFKTTSYGSSPALSVLLDDADLLAAVGAEDSDYRKYSLGEDESHSSARSPADESLPDLESDDRSIFSQGSPSTPGSIRSRKSSTNLRKDRARFSPVAEACALDHPLVSRVDDVEDVELTQSMQRIATPARKTRSSITSNLTTSLQSLKAAALNSISSFRNSTTTTTNPTNTTKPRTAAPPIDDMLWSHPYLFPRFSSETRPATDTHNSSTLTATDRSYLNPTPLTFEEQELPFQQALHGPYLAEQHTSNPPATTIQMQTYRGRGAPNGSRRASQIRRSNASNAPDPNSEAGRALLGAQSIRPREVRENGDFLRVVVLEMNMRREGKLEAGRARIWLPPREGSCGNGGESGGMSSGVPRRWVGESAY